MSNKVFARIECLHITLSQMDTRPNSPLWLKQAVGALILLQGENNDRHFAYLRQSGSERFLIVLNPSTEPSSVRINGIKPGNLSPQICHEPQAYVEGDNIQVKLAGISYGTFKL